jgi:uncharacterized protein (TIGR02246 family)
MRAPWMVLGVLVLAAGSGPAAFAQRADEEARIRRHLERYTAAWNRGDAKALASLYDVEGAITSASGHTVQGRDALEKGFAEGFAGATKGSRMTAIVGTIRFLKPDVAVVEGVWELSGLRGPDGKEMPPVKGLSLAVYVNKGREWLLAVGQTMLPAPASPAAPVI